MQGMLHWVDLTGGETKIGAPCVSNDPHFYFKSTSYDWRFDKNIKIKVGTGIDGDVYKEVWHAGNLDPETFNAVTASRLKIPVQLWGNTFDGSRSLNGTIKTSKVDFNNGYTLESDGSSLVFKFNGTVCATVTQSGITNGDGRV